MHNLSITPEVAALLAAKAPVAIGVSGGKDSHAVAWALSRYLEGYEGHKLLIHSDLGITEWEDSLPACQRLADKIDWELITVRRKAGGMMERWEGRWESSKQRYWNLRTAAVVLPWSTPAMRFCTSELKTDVITAALKKRFGQVPMLSVSGVRAQESTKRARQPVSSEAKKMPEGSVSWSPIHKWTVEEVWAAIAESKVPAHEAYGLFGSSRVSCIFCIMSSLPDLKASLSDPRSHDLYRRMCELELTSAFSFQNTWLSSLRPDLLEDGDLRLMMARGVAAARQEAQAWIPKHLAFTKGWPHCVPTLEECERLAEMRHVIGDLQDWEDDMLYVTGATVRDRYQELWDEKQRKAEKPKKKKS